MTCRYGIHCPWAPITYVTLINANHVTTEHLVRTVLIDTIKCLLQTHTARAEHLDQLQLLTGAQRNTPGHSRCLFNPMFVSTYSSSSSWVSSSWSFREPRYRLLPPPWLPNFWISACSSVVSSPECDFDWSFCYADDGLVMNCGGCIIALLVKSIRDYFSLPSDNGYHKQLWSSHNITTYYALATLVTCHNILHDLPRPHHRCSTFQPSSAHFCSDFLFQTFGQIAFLDFVDELALGR